jgi:hypothetical protein
MSGNCALPTSMTSLTAVLAQLRKTFPEFDKNYDNFVAPENKDKHFASPKTPFVGRVGRNHGYGDSNSAHVIIPARLIGARRDVGLFFNSQKTWTWTGDDEDIKDWGSVGAKLKEVEKNYAAAATAAVINGALQKYGGKVSGPMRSADPKSAPPAIQAGLGKAKEYKYMDIEFDIETLRANGIDIQK